MKTFRSDISNNEFPVSDKVSAKTIRHSILNLIQKDNPRFTHDSYLSLSELNAYRGRDVTEYLDKEIGELSGLEKIVINSLADNITLTDKIDGDELQILTYGQRIADKVASFGGSRTFIISFLVFIFIWI
jgi:low affinity Fe/Cu permease